MFQGETAITVDDKGRLAIPVAFREIVARDCGNRLVITYNPYEAGCIWLYPDSAWQKVRDQVVALPNAKRVHRNLQLMIVPTNRYMGMWVPPRRLSLMATGVFCCLQAIATRQELKRKRSCWEWVGNWNCGASRRTWRRSVKPLVKTRSATTCSI